MKVNPQPHNSPGETMPDWAYRLTLIAADALHIAEEALARVDDLEERLSGRKRKLVDGYVPAKTAAAYVGFSHECIRQWAARRAIKALKRGGQWFVDMESLQAFVALTPIERGQRMLCHIAGR